MERSDTGFIWVLTLVAFRYHITFPLSVEPIVESSVPGFLAFSRRFNTGGTDDIGKEKGIHLKGGTR